MSVNGRNPAGSNDHLECPSAQPGMKGARPFGVISGTPQETRIAFIKKSTLDAFDWRAQFATEEATRLFRFGARCEQSACAHFSGGQCDLGRRIKDQLPPVVDELPPCLIRPSCRWFAENGNDVCLRCPQVVTMIPAGETPLNMVALPPRPSRESPRD